MNNPYEDIINLPNHRSRKHPHMSNLDRAGQFSPFMALTGYEAVVLEEARLTDKRIELDDYLKADLNESLQIIKENLDERPEVSIVYFLEDKKKAGGRYISTIGFVKKIQDLEKILIMEDNTRIAIDDIIEIKY